MPQNAPGQQGGRLLKPLGRRHHLGVQWACPPVGWWVRHLLAPRHSSRPRPGGARGSADRLRPVDTYRTGVRSVGVVSVSESNPEEIEAQETRMNAGFSTFGRIAGRPKETEKERPEGPFGAAKRGEKWGSRPKVWGAERGENEAITPQNPPFRRACQPLTWVARRREAALN